MRAGRAMPRVITFTSPRPWRGGWPRWRCAAATRWRAARRCLCWMPRPRRWCSSRPRRSCRPPARRRPTCRPAAARTKLPRPRPSWPRRASRPRWPSANGCASARWWARAPCRARTPTPPAARTSKASAACWSCRPRCAWRASRRGCRSAPPPAPRPRRPATHWRSSAGVWSRRPRPRPRRRWCTTPTSGPANGCRPASRWWRCCRPRASRRAFLCPKRRWPACGRVARCRSAATAAASRWRRASRKYRTGRSTRRR